MSPTWRGNFYCSKLVIVEPIASGLKHKFETVEVKTKIPCMNETLFLYFPRVWKLYLFKTKLALPH
jgi:hypothetical protein